LVGLKRAGCTSAEINALKKAYRILYHSGYTLDRALQELELFPDEDRVRHLHHFLQLSIAGNGRRGPIPGNKSAGKDGSLIVDS
jgi:UDP-N-acetylglucosamine acyltransferase